MKAEYLLLALLAWVMHPAIPEVRALVRSPYQVLVRAPKGDRWSIM